MGGGWEGDDSDDGCVVMLKHDTAVDCHKVCGYASSCVDMIDTSCLACVDVGGVLLARCRFGVDKSECGE